MAPTIKNLLAMQEVWVHSLGLEDPLEKGMATHFNNLAWRIPSTEEPGDLPGGPVVKTPRFSGGPEFDLWSGN